MNSSLLKLHFFILINVICSKPVVHTYEYGTIEFCLLSYTYCYSFFLLVNFDCSYEVFVKFISIIHLGETEVQSDQLIEIPKKWGMPTAVKCPIVEIHGANSTNNDAHSRFIVDIIREKDDNCGIVSNAVTIVDSFGKRVKTFKIKHPHRL